MGFLHTLACLAFAAYIYILWTHCFYMFNWLILISLCCIIFHVLFKIRITKCSLTHICNKEHVTISVLKKDLHGYLCRNFISRLIFVFFFRRKLLRTCWLSSTWAVMHIAQSMFIECTCQPFLALEVMLRAIDTRRPCSRILPLETGEIHSSLCSYTYKMSKLWILGLKKAWFFFLF